ncbi:hypothetical protein Dimus_008399 [Dionaea muscipula]
MRQRLAGPPSPTTTDDLVKEVDDFQYTAGFSDRWLKKHTDGDIVTIIYSADLFGEVVIDIISYEEAMYVCNQDESTHMTEVEVDEDDAEEALREKESTSGRGGNVYAFLDDQVIVFGSTINVYSFLTAFRARYYLEDEAPEKESTSGEPLCDQLAVCSGRN